MEKPYPGNKPAHLSRLFALSSLVFIVVACIASSLLISRFVTDKMIRRDMEITTAFVQSLAVVQQARGYFLGHTAPDENLNQFIRHISAMPGVVRANVYARDRTVLWSSNRDLIGKRFVANPELDEIFMEKGKSHTGVIGEDVLHKAEHHELGRDKKIIETYVAVLDPQTRLVMGAIEFYKNPQSLWDSIRTLNQWIWGVAFGVGCVLYAALMLFMRRLGRLYNQIDPDSRISRNMAHAVSRGMRHSIANSEMSKAGGDKSLAANVGSWAESLDRYARNEPARLVATSLSVVIDNCYGSLRQSLELARIQFSVDMPANLPAVLGDPIWLHIAIDNVLKHAIEAIPPGGSLAVTARADESHGLVYLEIRDSGNGVNSGTKPCEETVEDLELARYLIDRMNGRLILAPLINGACDRTLRLTMA